MPNLRHLKKRIRLVRNIAQVTRAMQVAAALKMKRAQDAAISSRVFAKKLGEIAGLVAGQTATISLPTIDLILVAPDRGLCGSLLSNLQKGLAVWVFEVGRDRVRVICVNKKAVTIASRLGLNIVGVFSLSIASPAPDQMTAIIKLVNQDMAAAVAGSCLVGYAHYQNLMVQKFATSQILPFEVIETQNKSEVLIEPDRQQLYQSLIPRSMRLKLYQAILETTASEFSARAMAMKSASDNAADISLYLTSTYNRSRQAAITAQIAEVIGATLSSD